MNNEKEPSSLERVALPAQGQCPCGWTRFIETKHSRVCRACGLTQSKALAGAALACLERRDERPKAGTMKSKTKHRSLQHVVPANKRGPQLPACSGAARRSRQVWATLEAELGKLKRLLRRASISHRWAYVDEARDDIAALQRRLEPFRRRRPLGGNAKLTDRGGDEERRKSGE